MAFARDAQVRGQWTAFAAAAAPDAVMFVPQMVWAQQWLKGRANPPQSVRWQPHAVWSSCDGSLVVSHGAWQGPKAAGWFTTVWRRERDGTYKWVLDHGDSAATALAEPEMISAQVADCPARRRLANSDGGRPVKRVRLKDQPPLDPSARSGASVDASLRWDVVVGPDGARTLTVRWRKDGADSTLLAEQVAAPAPR